MLVALYEATDGDNWTNNTNWLSDRPLGEWHGVTTDANGRVTRLDLRANELTGAIPQTLGQLQNLTILLPPQQPVDGGDSTNTGTTTKPDTTVPPRQPVDGVDSTNPRTTTKPAQACPSSDNELTGAIPQTLGQLQNLTSPVPQTTTS